jgi:hypothetical protein
MSYERTPEHRALRAEMIHRWKPWEKSTGPKTLQGKARAARRGFKGGLRGLLRRIASDFREQRKFLEKMKIKD